MTFARVARSIVEFLIGVLLALAVSVFAMTVGLDRDRAFYPTATIVIASYYALFAIVGGSLEALAAETVAVAAFIALAVLGFRGSLWLIVLALAGHGIFDAVHPRLVPNPGVPRWWPMFCLAYDVTAAAFLAWLLVRGRIDATGSRDSLQGRLP
jgi:hypothetical protein